MALNPFKRWREKKAETTKEDEVKENSQETMEEEKNLPFFAEEEEKTVPSMAPVEEEVRTSADHYDTLVSKDSEKASEAVSSAPEGESGEYIRRSWESVSEIEEKIDGMASGEKRTERPRSEINKKVEDVLSDLEKRKRK